MGEIASEVQGRSSKRKSPKGGLKENGLSATGGGTAIAHQS